MADDGNTNFFNKYVNVLKSKYDQQTGDLINLEAQIMIMKENINLLVEENKTLSDKLQKLELKEKTAKAATTKKTAETES